MELGYHHSHRSRSAQSPRFLTKATLSILASVALSLTGSAGAFADASSKGELKLKRALNGRIEEKPVSCINLSRSGRSRIIDGTAVIFDIGSKLYVNRPTTGADSLSDSKIILTKTMGAQICRGEVVKLLDPSSHMLAGLVFLGDFVPYRKAPPPEQDMRPLPYSPGRIY